MTVTVNLLASAFNPLTARLSHFIAIIVKESRITASTKVRHTSCLWVGGAWGDL